MKVNGQEASPGCYIEGSHGQYGLDMLADVAKAFDLVVIGEDAPALWRKLANAAEQFNLVLIGGDANRPMKPEAAWERHAYAADQIEERLNEATEGGHWEWRDGEFFLTQTEVERWLYVSGTDYDDAWETVRCARINEHAGYTDQYEAVELADDDGDPKQHVYQFKIAVHYESQE